MQRKSLTGSNLILAAIPFMLIAGGLITLTGCGDDDSGTGPDGTPTWQAQDPLLEGNVLRAVDFVDSLNGWLVGDGGTILQTKDGGEFWSVNTSGTGKNLLDVTFMNQDSGCAVGETGTILRTIDAGNTWSLVQQVGTLLDLHAVACVGGGEAWAVGEAGVVLHTTSGGLRWNQELSNTQRTLRGAVFSDTIGFAVGARGVVARTTRDNPNTADWHDWETADQATEDLWGVAMVGDETAWAVGDNGTILHTADGGVTWQPQASPVSDDLRDVAFFDESTGWAVGVSGSVVYTTNGGSTWSAADKITARNLFAVDFVNSNNGWAAGEFVILTTSDGVSWSTQASGSLTLPNLQKVIFVNDDVGWAIGETGTIIRTTDGGMSWAYQLRREGAWLFDVQFVDPLTGWCAGISGVPPYSAYIIKTDDGGDTWTGQSTEALIDTFRCSTADSGWISNICMVDESNGWVVGGKWTTNSEGVVLHTNDGGANWVLQQVLCDTIVDTFAVPDTACHPGQMVDTIVINTTPRLHGVSFLSTQSGWAAGAYGTIVQTNDGGDTWTRLMVDSQITFHDIDFASAASGWVVGRSGVVMQTQDGTNWVERSVPTNKDLLSIVFLDADHGWIVGEAGTVLYTRNGGQTWAVQRSGTSLDLLSVMPVNTENVWIVGENGIILKTTTGGN